MEKRYNIGGEEYQLWFVLEYYKNIAERIEGLAEVLLAVGNESSLDNDSIRDGLMGILALIRDNAKTVGDGLNVIFNDLHKTAKT